MLLLFAAEEDSLDALEVSDVFQWCVRSLVLQTQQTQL